MRNPELDLALICDSAGIDPEKLRAALDSPSGVISFDAIASWFPGLNRERILSVFSLGQRYGALIQVSGEGAPLNSRSWRPVSKILDVLFSGAKAIHEAIPNMKEIYTQGDRFRIAATIPRTLHDMEDFFRHFENTALGMRRLIVDSRKELHIMVPFIDETGFGTLLQAIEDSLRRRVRVSFISRHLGEGQRNRAVLEGLVGISRESGGSLFLYDANLDEDSPVSHAKVISRDDGEEVYIGSANLTASSMERIIEIGVFLQGPGARPVHDFLANIMKRSVKRWP